MTIEPMRSSDVADVLALLRANKLPIDGFEAHAHTALVARDGARIIASAALEVYPPYALLRSVAVDSTYRGQGLGQLITSEAIALARGHGVKGLYLLTETAGQFFPKFGFTALPRTAVPGEVQQSIEFRSACPASAQAMALLLG